MMRTYHLIRYIPDPVRGEMINIAIVAFADGGARVMALPVGEVKSRTFRVAPHVDPTNAIAFVGELTSSAQRVEAVQQLLSVFDPHFRIEEPRRLSASVDLEATLATAYRELVAQPVKRRRKPETGKWTIQKALDALGGRVPTFAANAKRKVSVRDQPAVFGFESDFFADSEPVKLPAFDAVMPNSVRVLALRGLVVGDKMHASTFFETRADLDNATGFFGARASSKQVITGALLLPNAGEQVSLATRDGMRGGLSEVVGVIQVEGLAERTAVFDLSNPADERYLEQLSVIFAHPHE